MRSGKSLCSAEQRRKNCQGKKARSRLMEALLPQVVDIAEKYTLKAPLPELIGEGLEGLILAAEEYDAEVECGFSDFALEHIRSAITDAANAWNRLHSVSNIDELFSRMIVVSDRIKKKLGKEPSDETLARVLNTTPERILWLRKGIKRIEFPHKFIWVNPAIFEWSRVKEKQDEAYEENASPQKWVEALLRTLSPMEEKVLRLRYGLNAEVPHTWDEIGEKLHMTGEQVRQLEKNAQRKLKSKKRILMF